MAKVFALMSSNCRDEWNRCSFDIIKNELMIYSKIVA